MEDIHIQNSSSPVLGKREILATELRKICVEVPELGGRIWLRELSASERDEYEAVMLNQPDPFDIHAILKVASITPVQKWKECRASLLSISIVDEEGKRLFSKADIEELGNKSGKGLQRLFHEATRLSGLA